MKCTRYQCSANVQREGYRCVPHRQIVQNLRPNKGPSIGANPCSTYAGLYIVLYFVLGGGVPGRGGVLYIVKVQKGRTSLPLLSEPASPLVNEAMATVHRGWKTCRLRWIVGSCLLSKEFEFLCPSSWQNTLGGHWLFRVHQSMALFAGRIVLCWWSS